MLCPSNEEGRGQLSDRVTVFRGDVAGAEGLSGSFATRVSLSLVHLFASLVLSLPRKSAKINIDELAKSKSDDQPIV